MRNDIQRPLTIEIRSQWSWRKKACVKLVDKLVPLVSLFYTSVYYYYFPFLVNFIPYFFAGDPNHKLH